MAIELERRATAIGPRALLLAFGLLATTPSVAQQVEKVRAGTPDAPGLPEDLFSLPPDNWVFAKQLWKGDEPCTKDQCEAGYTSGDLVVSVERSKTAVRVVAGFRGCGGAVAWNEYEIGDKASNQESKTVRKRVKKVVSTSAKYCKGSKPTVPTIAQLDARRLYPTELGAQ